ncbi:hypothetical protein [Gudongella sp. SC589]|jgi:hypothetical protein|uniref:hypothetical protein n=1 Tax=Gudongella sp. SC589 TaxID=3385990 RepID=UPI0039046780
MKIKNWAFVIITAFILIVYGLISSPRDEITSMKNIISRELKTKNTVTIINTIVINDYRLTSYVLKDADEYEKAGYVYFRINNSGNYELISLIDADNITEKVDNIFAYEFSELDENISSIIKEDYSVGKSSFIISNNSQLAKIERIIDNGEIQTIIIDNNPLLLFFEI